LTKEKAEQNRRAIVETASRMFRLHGMENVAVVDVIAAFADGIESYLDIFCLRMAGDKREARQRSIALLSNLVGALLLARAVKKGRPELSDEFLGSARKQISKEIGR
jgi:hypothetical protein